MKSYEQIGVAMTCRGFEEYTRMFALDEVLPHGKEILDVAAGASSFTADACERGYSAVAVDPRYALAPDRLKTEALQEIESSMAKLEALREKFDWTYYGDLTNHRQGRLASLERFAEDLERPDSNKRYYAGGLPKLPFENERFSLVLCSHFLFLYAQQFDYEFHLQALDDLMRVCRPGGQIRIYPLTTLQFIPYPHLDELLDEVRRRGGRPELMASGLPFIPGSRQYLKISL